MKIDSTLNSPTQPDEMMNGKASDDGGFISKFKLESLINKLNFGSTNTKFTNKIYQDLPPLLKVACEILVEDTEKEVFLFGAIGTLSGLLPKVQGLYDNKVYSPQIYNFLVGKYGEGKGILLKARFLGKYVHQMMVDRYQTELDEYEHNDKKGNAPKHKLLFIPANKSKTGIVKLLNANRERGIMFLSEADTLADILKQDYANFSDILRGAFHHEGYELYRSTDGTYLFIERGYLAVVISGTYDQLFKLIPGIENGLFSRFLYYKFNPKRGVFKNVLHNKKKDYTSKFDRLALDVLEIYKELEALESPVVFSLSEEQKRQFHEIFQQWKTKFSDLSDGDLDGVINRLGLIAFRIMMQFTTLREVDKGFNNLPQEIVCEDIDFINALRIVQVSLNNAVEIYNSFPSKKKGRSKQDNKPDLSAIAKLLHKYDSKQFSTRKIGQIIGASHTKVSTLLKS